jgi:hypothetical protein
MILEWISFPMGMIRSQPPKTRAGIKNNERNTAEPSVQTL